MDNNLKFKFLERVKKQGTCWVWTGATDGEEWPLFPIKRSRTVRAHRFIYQDTFGEIPFGRIIRHQCGNRKCVNPHHMEVVKRKSQFTKLTESQIEEIKNTAHFVGRVKTLAKRFKVTVQTIYVIDQGKTWKQI